MSRITTPKISECPFATTQLILSSKWGILILHHIESGPIRFSELHRKLSGISQATLTKQLRQLEQAGLITRKIYATVPPKVEYELSEIGREFRLVLEEIKEFGRKYIEYRGEK